MESLADARVKLAQQSLIIHAERRLLIAPLILQRFVNPSKHF